MNDHTLNHYAPPRARVADLAPDEPVAELKLFSHEGRIGRLRYLAYVTGASMVYGIAISVVAALTITSPVLTMVATLAFLVVLVWFTMVSGIKRCHDADLSGWCSLLGFIPLVGLAFIVVPGTQRANRFGAPPPPNTWGVRLLAVVLPVVCVVGILAAIAIPQYAIYTAKARAAQQAGQR
jgi:uncharacterized membrane protein YhaH (DUF805 family)